MSHKQKDTCIRSLHNGVTVVLDTNLTEELIEEGFVFEVISKIQTMRKDSDFEVMDHIEVSLNGNETIESVVQKNEKAIAEKVLADVMVYGQGKADAKEWNVNGENVWIAVSKVK
jgi:isoleucyl-tRNA synthetase